MTFLHSVLADIAAAGPRFAEHVIHATLFALAMVVLYRCVRNGSAALRHSILLAAILRFAIPTPWLSRMTEYLEWQIPRSPTPAHGVFFYPLNWIETPLRGAGHHSEVNCFLTLLWAAGTVLFLAFRTARMLRLMSLIRGGEPVQTRVPGAPKAFESDVSHPCLVGFWNPAILLPRGLSRQLHRPEFDAVVLHEAAHARRRDNWSILLQVLVSSFFWFHPLLWWLNRQIANERELACDAAVLQAGAAPNDYVSAIAKILKRSMEGSRPGLAAVSGSNLKVRLEAIMNGKLRSGIQAWERLAGRSVLASAIIAGLAGAAFTARPVVLTAAQALSNSSPYDKWLNEDVVYIISPVERERFRQLKSNPERDQFIQQFWQIRDPDPTTAENPVKEEHYRRIAYANGRFAGEIPGWQTHRGRIYIVFGPPDEIEQHLDKGYQRWRYRAGMFAGVWLEFRDR